MENLINSTGIPFAVTQAGKSSLDETNSKFVGSIGVTGSSVANELAKKSDLVISVGSRLQDFTTGSNTLISCEMISINVQNHDVVKHKSISLLGNVLAANHAKENKSHEAVLFDNRNMITEGNSSSIWIIKKNKCITHPLNFRILKGCTCLLYTSPSPRD